MARRRCDRLALRLSLLAAVPIFLCIALSRTLRGLA
jgi:hypothetical protein